MKGMEERIKILENQLLVKEDASNNNNNRIELNRIEPNPRSISIPLAAQGHEQVYERFLRGKLIYKPDPNNNNGRIELPISALKNPLEGAFDLSQCGDTGNYLSISTGFRKGKKDENANKVEIWFAPRFLVEKELNTTARHLKEIFPSRWDQTAQVGILWSWGGWKNLGWYDYLTTQNMEQLGDNHLHKKWLESERLDYHTSRIHDGCMYWEGGHAVSCYFYELK